VALWRKRIAFIGIFVIILSFLHIDAQFVRADSKKEGNITSVTDEKIEGWATSPGEGNGKGNTITHFDVRINVKGQKNKTVSYRTDAVEVPADRNGEKKYTFSLDMTGKWPEAQGETVTYEIVVVAYREAGEYFSFPSVPYEYEKRNSQSSAHLDFDFTSPQNEYAKPPNGDAQGRLDVTLIPKGRVDSIVRPPIDVVFVFDVSGSMTWTKLESAKAALRSAAQYFKANANPNDRFALIPFSDIVKNVVPFSTSRSVADQLDEIIAVGNSLTAGGGTNYSAALSLARSYFNDPARKRYIIFLTDGMPTVLNADETLTYNEVSKKKKHEYVYTGETKTGTFPLTYEIVYSYRYSSELARVRFTDNRGYERTVYSNGEDYANGEYVGENSGLSFSVESVRSHIQSAAIDIAKTLGLNNITLYSIGFGTADAIDMDYLQKLSATAGGEAKQGTTQNLTELFQKFSQLATDPALTGTIKIPLAAFNGKVEIKEDGQVWLDENKQNAYISFSIPYQIGQPAPPPVTIPVSVSFKEKGTYTFTAELSYRNVYGELQPTATKSVTVVVKDEVPPSFNGTVTLRGISQDVASLIKHGAEDGDDNRFEATYSLTPAGYVGSATGTISNIKLIQQLPDGITVLPEENVTTYVKDGVHYAEMTFPNKVIDYTQLNSITLTVKWTMQADWAMDDVQLPPPSVEFTDSRYGARTSTLMPPAQKIGMKVRIDDFPNMYYEGDQRGLITKWQAFGAVSSELGRTKHPNDYGLLTLPVKSLQYKQDDSSVLLVTYSNNQTVSVYLQPRLLIVTKSGATAADGATVTEAPTVKVADRVAGEGVTYEYKIDRNGTEGSWQPLAFPYDIPISDDGRFTVSVRSKGGLTRGDGTASVTFTYVKLIKQLTLGPYQATMNVGETQTIPVTIEPSDATNKTLQWTSSDPDVATVVDGTVTAVKPGKVEITVKATDGSNAMATATITVIAPLEAIDFQKEVLYMTVGEELDVESQLTFIPSYATDKRLDSVQSSAPEYVEARLQQGKWYIVAKEVGYSTITAIAKAKTKNGQEIKDSITVIVREKSSSGNDEESGKNRW
jgi:uncharacterized protein YegL